MKFVFIFPTLIFFLLVLSGCNPMGQTPVKDADFLPGLPTGQFPDHIEVVSGDNQTGYSAVALSSPLVVKVFDVLGIPVANANLSVSVLSGGGSSDALVTTGTGGTASITWTLGSAAGSNTLKVQGVSALPGVTKSVTFSATSLDPVADIANSSISGTGSVIANGVAASTITITLIDQYGSPVENIIPLFSATNTGSTNSYGACSSTNGAGVSTCTMTSTKAEIKTLSITSPIPKSGGVVSFIPGAIASIGFSTQPSTTGDTDTALVSQPVVSAYDANSNIVTNNSSATITLAPYSDACSTPVANAISATSNPVTLSSGVATFANVKLLKTNAVRIGASDGTNTACSNVISVSPGAIASIGFTTEPSTTGDTDTALAVQPVIKAYDANSNIVTSNSSATITLAAYSDACTTPVASAISATTNPLTLASGVATFVNTKILKTNVVRLRASDGTNTVCSSSNMAISAGAPNSLAFTTQPSGTSNSQTPFAQQPVVEVLDTNGNRATNATTAITLSSHSNGTCSSIITNGISATTNPLSVTSGLASFTNVIATKPSAIRIAASGGGLTPICSTAIAITPVAFTSSWPFSAGTTTSYTSSSWTAMEFSGGVVRLTGSDQVDDDNSATGFTGTFVGVDSYGPLAGEVGSNGLNLGSNGGCDGSTTACAQQTVPEIYELNSSWTAQWGSLVSYYKFNEAAAASSVTDSKGSNNGTPTSVTFGGSGKISNTGSFNGSNGYISVPSSANLSITGNLTISSWIKFSTKPSIGNFVVIASKVNTANPWEGYSLGINSNGALSAWISNGTTLGWSDDTGYDLSNGVWHFIALTLSSTTATFYVDGSVKGIFTKSAPGSNSQPLIIGRDGSGSIRFFNGFIDELAIWSAALTAAQLANIYQRQSPAYTGTFTSRVMDAGASPGSAANWTSLSWSPTLPFFKPLPDYASGAIQNETSTSYSSLVGSTQVTGANDLMTGIVGLWHMDETSWNGTASEVVDKSGQGNHGTATNGALIITDGGRFKNAGYFDRNNDYIAVPAINFAAAGATFSLWFNLDNTTGDKALAGKNADNDTYISISGSSTIIVQTDTGATVKSFTVPTLSPGTWYHLTVTRSSNSTRVYLNGTESSSGAQTQSAVLTINQLARYSSFTGFNFGGSLDEIAIWSRALGATEVKQLYQRGASRIKFQARSCDDNACSGETWKGPDGTSATYFSELFNMTTQAVIPSGSVSPSGPSMTLQNYTNPVGANQYFQYRAILESDSSTVALMPELKSVTIGPTHYYTTSPSIYNNTGVDFYTLSAFTETISCSGGIGYNLSLDKISWYWWDATANAGSGEWVMANGTVAQSNSGTTTNSHIAAFGSQFGVGEIYFKSYLQSNGVTSCSIDNLQISGSH